MPATPAIAAESPPPSAWDACRAAFQRDLTPQQFVTWIQPLACAVEGQRLTLTAPNRFVLQWVRERFGGRIAQIAAEALGGPVTLEYAVADPAAAGPAQAPRPAPAAPSRRCGRSLWIPSPPMRPSGSWRDPPSWRPVTRKGEAASLNPTFNFSTFVSGKANQLARAAGLQVADHPTSYNPLFVYGGVGLGKTHLIQAIGNHILASQPGGADQVHPRRDLRQRRGPRLPAQGLRRVQAALPHARPPAHRRHPVLRRQEPHAGGVLLPLQHPDRGRTSRW